MDHKIGKIFFIQWFKRNRFKLHREYAAMNYEVLLGLLGKDMRKEALAVDPDFQLARPFSDPVQSAVQQVYKLTGIVF